MRQGLYELLLNNQGALTKTEVLMNFLVAAVISVLIFASYKISHHAVLYSRKFNVSLVMLVLVTTLVMNVIGNNIALSLGMVGALSIVRFRTAVKDPRDTAYIFWAIAVGICCGVSDYFIAVTGSLVIFAFLLVFGVLKDGERVMVIVRLTDAGGAGKVKEAVESFLDKKVSLLVENISTDSNDGELIFECAGAALTAAQNTKGALSETLAPIESVGKISVVRQEDEVHQ